MDVAESVIGYDLNEKYCQISYYSEKDQEPQTMEMAADNSLIPVVLGRHGDTWVYGNEAKRLENAKGSVVISDLFVKSMMREKVQVGEDIYEAVWLLAKFIELSLDSFEEIEHLVFTVPKMSVDIGKILKGIGQRIGVAKECIYVQDYKESFCNYMFYQPKELWHYEAALFHCDRNEVRAYMLRRLQTGRGRDAFVTVEEVSSAKMEELSLVYPVLNAERAKEADERFKRFVQNVFDKKMISSVFLTGEGFENNWYPLSLKVICNGRRAFLGNNLYSKGACYTAYRRSICYKDGPVYLDETKMTEQICLKLRVDGQDEWYPIVPWGTRWYESDMQCEILLEDAEDIEIHIEPLVGHQIQVEKVSMEGLPKRKDYALRLQVKILFLNEGTCRISFKDVGFGEFFPATDFYIEKEIHLGGSNGQFNSLL